MHCISYGACEDKTLTDLIQFALEFHHIILRKKVSLWTQNITN